MTRPYRALWLPAIAVLAPCAFIAVLGVQWLAVEREAAAHRGSEAAQEAAAALRRDLLKELRRIADVVSQSLSGFMASRPPFAPPPSVPALVSKAWLFDASGRLLAPNYEGASAGSISTAAEASRLLHLAREAASAGRGDLVERHAADLAACCPDVRDEYGVAVIMYAAWQRAELSLRQPDAVTRLRKLEQDLDALIGRGFLGATADVSTMAALAANVRSRVDLGLLTRKIDLVRKETDQRIEGGRAARRWLANHSAPPPHGDGILAGTIREGASGSVAVRADVAGDRTVVMVLAEAGLDEWTRRWAAERPFVVRLKRAGGSRDAGAVVETPLLPEAPLQTVSIYQPMNPAIDARQRLLAAALGSTIVLALIIGFLAVRDVSREVKTASMRSAFVAAVTHELKTPLASIRLLAETLKGGRTRPDAAPELLDTIVGEADRLTRLVDNVLSSSRLESGTHAYRPQVVLAGDVVRSAIRRLQSVVDREGLALVDRFPDEAVRVRADPDGLYQSVLNLLGNAVKYSGNGREIRVTVGRRNGFAEICVADDGIGIDADEHARIFDRFYRSPRAAAHTGGAGLGLTLVRHFADAHGGRVTVASEPGRGSAFTLWLPAVPGDG